MAWETIPASMFTVKVCLFTSEGRLWSGGAGSSLRVRTHLKCRKINLKGWWDNKKTRARSWFTVCKPKKLQTAKTKPTRERMKEGEKQTVDWQTVCSSNPLNQYKYEISVCLWLSACQETSKAATAHSARPANFVTPPQSTHRVSPLNCLSYLTLHSSVCVHTPLTWISGCLLDTQSSLVLCCLPSLPLATPKNVSASSSSSGSHKAWGTVPWMVHSTLVLAVLPFHGFL